MEGAWGWATTCKQSGLGGRGLVRLAGAVLVLSRWPCTVEWRTPNVSTICWIVFKDARLLSATVLQWIAEDRRSHLATNSG